MLKIFLATVGIVVGLALVVSLFRSLANTAQQPSGTELSGLTKSTESLENTSWLATTLNETSITDAGITAQFEDGTLSGSDGCNRYTTSYTINGSQLTIKTPLAGTQMACPAAVMVRAAQYTTALAQVVSFQVKDGTLSLSNAADAVVLTYREDAQSLTDTQWNVTGVNNGNNAVTSLIAGTTITLNFVGESEVSGNSGCNTYRGEYAATESNLTLNGMISTMRYCIEPEGVSDQESQYLEALRNITTFAIENNSLVMRDKTGAMQVTAQRQ